MARLRQLLERKEVGVMLVATPLLWISLHGLLGPSGAAEQQIRGPEVQGYSIVNSFPHDPQAFTQGLHFEQYCSEADEKSCRDTLWESTGGL